MKHEDIIRMAREAGFVVDEKAQQHQPNCIFPTHHMVDELLARFAALIASRVAAAATEEANRRANASWSLMCKKMVAAEREACAKVCEDLDWSQDSTWQVATLDCATAIRARANT